MDATSSGKHAQERPVLSSMDNFLASVEKQAFVIARTSCGDEQQALDIVQDAMLSMVSKYAQKSADQWPPLFFKILNNKITDQHRKRGFGRLTRWFGMRSEDDAFEGTSIEAVDQLDDGDFTPEVMADSYRLQEAFSSALEKLSFRQQQALMLRLWQGLSVKETAVAMGVSEGSVKTHLSRAVREIRPYLEDYRLHE